MRPIPEHLPGEPALPVLSPLATLGRLLWLYGGLLLAVLLALPLWPVWLLLRPAFGHPPHVPTLRRYGWLLRTTAAAPGLRRVARLGLAARLLIRAALAPLAGLAWILDEVLYGRAIRATPITAPVFEISAARSGSTQLAHYLEDDPRVVAPSVFMTLFPYLWLWRLAGPTLGRLLDREQVRAAWKRRLPERYLQRHEFDPYRTDTFEVLCALLQSGDIVLQLGSEVARHDLGPARAAPADHPAWEAEMVRFIDALGRKLLLHARPQGGQEPRRLLVKGHFLPIAAELERRYPDARFLTVVREPLPRLRSVLNYLRDNPTEPLAGLVPWGSLVAFRVPVELDYCDEEMDFYGRSGGARRCVIRFEDYVRDLKGTLRRVYRDCLDEDELPPHLPRQHAERERERYSLDRTLEQLGLDPAALEARLEGYRRWRAGGLLSGREVPLQAPQQQEHGCRVGSS